MKVSARQKLLIAMLLMGAVGLSFARNKNEGYEFQTESSTSKNTTSQFATGATYSLCFVPDGAKCETLLVETINNVKNSLWIQAYSFTNPVIAEAVSRAHSRGVDVRVIVDKSQASEKYTSARFLKNVGIPVVIDVEPAIAHNKVMIFDGNAVFTGSFNFTKAAQYRNAENGIVIKGDSALVKSFSDNWVARYKKSIPY